MKSYKKKFTAAAAALFWRFATAAHADMKVGIDLSSTGPAAVIGITSKNAMLMWPATIAGQKADYIFLDDASDPGAAVRNIRKLINEDHVDVIVGPNITPAAMAALDPVAESQTPMITLIGSASVVEPQEGKKVWAYKMAQTDSAMADVMTRYMSNHNVKTVGFIGFADGYGESWLNEFSKFAALRHIQLVATERYNRTDASVTGQILKLMAAKPDAILIAGAGTPTVLPQRTLIERGYKGRSIRRTASPRRSSSSWAARTWKARCSRPSRSWSRARCRPIIRRRRRRSRSRTNMRRSTARAA